MRLSSFISQINQNFMENMGAEGTSFLEQGLKNGMEAILGKLPGQAVTGEVLVRNGNDILISLGQNQLLQAKLEGNMAAQPGQLLTFQIKNNGASKVVLSPLFENLSQDPNVSKALKEAGLPENNVTVKMVKAMMQEGLPIDRKSLYQMNRYVNLNPQTDVQTLVQMQRLSLPISENNIFQFEAYKNYQHQLGQSLSDIADAFIQSFQELTGNGNIQEGLGFYKEVLNLLIETEMPEQPSSNQIPVSPLTEIQLLEPEEFEKLTSQLKQAGVSDHFLNAVISHKVDGQGFLKEVAWLLSDETVSDKEAVFELLEGKPFKHILKNEMNRQWLLQPEEVAQEHNVDKLYERLNSQISRLNEVLSQTVKTDTPLAKTVSNVKGNIDFMNQLNQMFTYVQLPLKLQGQNASGELFVYTNKKSLAKKEGSVSALLHLDMEHLGSMDVHVSLNNQKVSTKFYLQDESSLDLIAQNIHILNERLEDRGYSMKAEFISREGTTNVMDEILAKDKNISVLAGYSFDARA